MKLFPRQRHYLSHGGFGNGDVLNLFDDIFKDLARPATDSRGCEGFRPAINVKEDEKHYIVEAELAGLKKEDVDVSIRDNALILKGEKKIFDEEKKENFHRIERSYGSFYRAIALGSDADLEKISAKFEDGLLRVEVAKYEGIRNGHRKIDIA